MIFSFENYNNEEILKNNLDNKDMHILGYIQWLLDNETNIWHFDNKKYTNVTIKKIISQNPTLYIKSRALETRISKLVDKGFIEKKICCVYGSYKKTFMRTTNVEKLLKNTKNEDNFVDSNFNFDVESDIDIVNSDAFLNLDFSSQVLYFHLCSRANNSGIICCVNGVCRMLGISKDTVKKLESVGLLMNIDAYKYKVKRWFI